MNYFISNIDNLKLSAWALTIVVACNRLGAWLDKEADNEWKTAIRRYLQSGAWLDRLQAVFSTLTTIFERVYGKKYLSYTALKRSIQLSTIPLVIVILLLAVFQEQLWMFLAWEAVAFALIPRVLINIALDYINIMRSKYVIYRLSNTRHFIQSCLAYLVVDLAALFILSLVFNILAMNVFSILYTWYLTKMIQPNFQIDFLNLMDKSAREFMSKYFLSLIFLHEKEGTFVIYRFCQHCCYTYLS